MSQAQVAGSAATGFAAVRLGWLVHLDPAGRPLVDYPDNPHGPVLARSIVGLTPPAELSEQPAVILLFESEASSAPIILGLVSDTMGVVETSAPRCNDACPREARLDGRRVILEAQDQIELRCGDSSILLRKDGRIVIRGAHLLSRASHENKIRGASVAIN
jgi:hypothetical protein